MSYLRDIVVISDKNDTPARLRIQIDPVKLDKDIGMAITSIYHGEILNVHSKNNTIFVNWNYADTILDSDVFYSARLPTVMGVDLEPRVVDISTKIPVGRYNDRMEILIEINKVLQNVLRIEMGDVYSQASLEFSFSKIKKQSDSVTITPTDVKITTVGEGTPWSLLGVTTSINSQLVIQNQSLDPGLQPAFLYANVVENSYINGKKSRNLSILPLQQGEGYVFHEFANLVYVPVEVKQFSDMLLEIRDMNGELVTFDDRYKTIITLHFKDIK